MRFLINIALLNYLVLSSPILRFRAFSSAIAATWQRTLILIGPRVCIWSADWLMQIEPYRTKLECDFVDRTFLFSKKKFQNVHNLKKETSHNVNKLSQNMNMWITQFWQKCQIEPYNSKGTICVGRESPNLCIGRYPGSSWATRAEFWMMMRDLDNRRQAVVKACFTPLKYLTRVPVDRRLMLWHPQVSKSDVSGGSFQHHEQDVLHMEAANAKHHGGEKYWMQPWHSGFPRMVCTSRFWEQCFLLMLSLWRSCWEMKFPAELMRACAETILGGSWMVLTTECGGWMGQLVMIWPSPPQYRQRWFNVLHLLSVCCHPFSIFCPDHSSPCSPTTDAHPVPAHKKLVLTTS